MRLDLHLLEYEYWYIQYVQRVMLYVADRESSKFVHLISPLGSLFSYR